jgi:hypothetical protein
MDFQNHSCVRIPRKTSVFQFPFQTIQTVQPSVEEDLVEFEHPMKKEERSLPLYEKEYRPTPNPVYPANATLPLLTPLAVKQKGNTVLVTASIPAEAIITLPTEALEIKRISKKLKITQCRFLHALAPILPGLPADTPKLFIGGFVRKDIQYTKVCNKTAITVEGDIRDFVIDVPISGVVNLGPCLDIPALRFDQEQEYEYASRTRLGKGFSDKERLLSPDFSEFNVISNKILNRLPVCELVYSQIHAMDDQLDRVELCGGPFEEGTFRTLQEKMVVVVQVAITFPPSFIPRPCRSICDWISKCWKQICHPH